MLLRSIFSEQRQREVVSLAIGWLQNEVEFTLNTLMGFCVVLGVICNIINIYLNTLFFSFNFFDELLLIQML